jgi:hypothetical protein
LLGNDRLTWPLRTHSLTLKKEVAMHEKYQSCIQACYACALECNHCLIACLQENDVKMMARCIALDLDCAEMCTLAAGAMARDSQVAGAICAACAAVCEACGEECARHAHDHCRRCAAACRQCAQECRQMALAA